MIDAFTMFIILLGGALLFLGIPVEVYLWLNLGRSK